jgi:hypothetical protein
MAVCLLLRVLGRGLERLAVAAEVEAVLDPLEQLVPVAFGKAEQDADRLHRELARDRGHEVALARSERVVDKSRGARAELGLQARDRARCQTFAHEHAHALVTRVVHHVQHLAGDRHVGDDRSAEGTVAARLRRERVGIVDHRHALRMGVHRPEAFAVGCVRAVGSCHHTGASRRKTVKISCGNPFAKRSRSVRSISSSRTPLILHDRLHDRFRGSRVE